MNKPDKRKPGRPSLGKAGRRQSFTFRIREKVRDLVVAAAQSSGVSVSEEIERRVEESFSKAGVVAEMFGGAETARLLFTFAIAIQEVERATGIPWWADVSTSEHMRRAINNIIEARIAKLPKIQKQIEERLATRGEFADLEPKLRAELERGPFIDHFQIGNDAAALAILKVKEELARRNAPVKAPVRPEPSPKSSSRKAKDK
jgi:hypothetical protein